MKRFEGFPARMRFTAVPNLFFSSLLPQIDDMAELKTTLHIFRSVYAKKGYPRFVSRGELLADKSLMSSLKGGEKKPEETLKEALETAVKRGTVIHLALEKNGEPEDLYFLNTESERRAVERIKNGELALRGLKAGSKSQPGLETDEPPDIFTLYEENVGMLNPLVAEWLKEAEKQYPETWIRDAIKEAVSLNKRNWRYIDRILESWAAEGKSDGTHKRSSETGPAKYSKQRYDHLVKR